VSDCVLSQMLVSIETRIEQYLLESVRAAQYIRHQLDKNSLWFFQNSNMNICNMMVEKAKADCVSDSIRFCEERAGLFSDCDDFDWASRCDEIELIDVISAAYDCNANEDFCFVMNHKPCTWECE